MPAGAARRGLFAHFTIIYGGSCDLKYLVIPPFLPLSAQKRAPGYPGYQEKFFESWNRAWRPQFPTWNGRAIRPGREPGLAGLPGRRHKKLISPGYIKRAKIKKNVFTTNGLAWIGFSQLWHCSCPLFKYSWQSHFEALWLFSLYQLRKCKLHFLMTMELFTREYWYKDASVIKKLKGSGFNSQFITKEDWTVR